MQQYTLHGCYSTIKGRIEFSDKKWESEPISSNKGGTINPPDGTKGMFRGIFHAKKSLGRPRILTFKGPL